MSESRKLAHELLKADGIASETEVERQLHQVREFIREEQAKIRIMKLMWMAIAGVVQVLLWIAIIWFPADKPQSNDGNISDTVLLIVNSLLPVVIVSACVALLLLHIWRTSRKEAQLRLTRIEEKLDALSTR